MGSREGRLAELGQLAPGRGPQFATLMVGTIRSVGGRSLPLPDRAIFFPPPTLPVREAGSPPLTAFRWTLSHSGQARPTRPAFCCLHAPGTTLSPWVRPQGMPGALPWSDRGLEQATTPLHPGGGFSSWSCRLTPVGRMGLGCVEGRPHLWGRGQMPSVPCSWRFQCFKKARSVGFDLQSIYSC